MVKIGLKQEEEEEGIVVETWLDSGATRLVMSEKFVKKAQIQKNKVEKADLCEEC